MPTVREERRMAIQHPAEVDALINRVRAPHDLRIVLETLPHREDAPEEQRRIDRRDLTLPLAGPRVNVQPVIEPPMHRLQIVGEGAKRRPCPREQDRPRLPPPLRRDTPPREPKP